METNAFDKLSLFKRVAFIAAKFVRHVRRDALANTTEHKLSVAVAFLRACRSMDWNAACRLQKKYVFLKDFELSHRFLESEACRSLRDHIMELNHTSIQERIGELKLARSQLPDHIYQQRKEHIIVSLKRLLPGGAMKINAVRDKSGKV